MTNAREILYELPFGNLTDFDLENSYSTSKERIVQLMENHGIYDFIKENHFSDLFNNQDIPECAYFSEDEFIHLKRDAPSNLNVFSMNIRSLPKHGGELTVFLKLLKADFDIVVLTEIGSRNIDTVKYLLDSHEFYHVAPVNMYGGVGIYVSNNITKVQTLDNIALTKTCRCSKCEMESLFLKVFYMNDEYVIAGIYRHPNGTVNHFVNDLEATLNKIDDKMTTVIVGALNIDIIKFENDNSVNYLTTFLSHCYLPLITLPTRFTDFSATCIDHIFIKIPSNKKSKLDGIAYGILYCDISDHLPCFLSLTCKSNANLTRPRTRIFGEKKTV